MSEREPTLEVGRNAEIDSKTIEKISESAAEKRREAAEAAAEKASHESLEKLSREAREKAASKDEVEASRLENGASESVLKASSQLKGLAYKQTLRSTQRKEKPVARKFSKLVHQPVVEEISTLAEGTVARPSGLLFGGIFSVLSSLFILYIAKHYGYEYNFLVGVVSFAGGFFLGLLVEGIWRVFKKSPR